MIEHRLTYGGRLAGTNPLADCAARALAIFLDEPYDQVEALLRAHTDYDPNEGVTDRTLLPLLESLGLQRVDVRVRLTSPNAHERLPRTCFLIFKHHISVYKEGVIYDAFNPTRVKGMKQTRYIYA